MDNSHLCNLAFQIRASAKNKANIFTVSTRTLALLLPALESLDEQSNSFHVKPNQSVELLQDLKYLATYITNVENLKLYGNSYEEVASIDLSKFSSLVQLELVRVDTSLVKGIQVKRPLLQKVWCTGIGGGLSEVLVKCGADQSPSYCWNELKEASFISCGIQQLDTCLECTPWLQILDLSHNELKTLDELSCLPNLKSLNISYNKLESFPCVKGQICTRLQNVVLKNNFIEDISGMRLFTNLCVLDLSNNCLVDHQALLSLAHSATLQYLNLTSNPIFFHPNHRKITAAHLHYNTSFTNFVLNDVALSKTERRLVGSFYPHQKSPNGGEEAVATPSVKVRRVREVVIVEGEEAVPAPTQPPKLSSSPLPHIETKQKVEDLKARYGESWLNSQSGILDVLGLEDSVRLSTSPYQADFTIYSGNFDDDDGAEVDDKPSVVDELNEEYATDRASPEIPDDVDMEGDETIYLATVDGETEPIFIVIGQTHIAEKETGTSEERMRWHVNSIKVYEKSDDTKVRLEFETMRTDKKQRIYVFESEIDEFLACIHNKMVGRPRITGIVLWQCMKCSTKFEKERNESVLVGASLKCPNCYSSVVVEDV